MKFLGHHDVKNTLIYIDLEIACFSKRGDEYHAKTARTGIEALQLIESGSNTSAICARLNSSENDDNGFLLFVRKHIQRLTI